MSNGMEWFGTTDLGNARYPQFTKGRYRVRLTDARIMTFSGQTGVAEFKILEAEGAERHPDTGSGPIKVGDTITYLETLNKPKSGGKERFGRMIAALCQRPSEHFGDKSKALTVEQRRGWGNWVISKDSDDVNNGAKYGIECYVNVLAMPAINSDGKPVMNEQTGKQKEHHNPTFLPASREWTELDAQGRPLGQGMALSISSEDSGPGLPDEGPDLPDSGPDLPEEPADLPVTWNASGMFQNPVRSDWYLQKSGAIVYYSSNPKPTKTDWAKYQAGVHPAPESPAAKA